MNVSGDNSYVSAASYACALLATIPRTRAITLSFYCGLHVRPTEKETGVGPLLANLIGQLLNIDFAFDLTFLVQQEQPELRALDVDLLCYTLRKLIRQLPRDQLIICMIDGISFYESPWYREAIKATTDTLVELVEEDDDTEAIIKVLLTCPASSIGVARRLSRGQTFTPEEDFDRTNQGFDGDMFGREFNDQLMPHFRRRAA